MKKGIFKYVMLIIDIIAITLIIVEYLKWNNNEQNKDNNLNQQIEKIKYRKFTFEIPNDITYANDLTDDKKFKLTSNNYKAIIEIYFDPDDYIINYPDIYYNRLINDNYKVDKPYKINIGNTEITIFNKHDEKNSLLCYFKNFTPFGIEIELYNKDNTFATTYLESIIKILLNAKYDIEDETLYTYHKIDFSDELDN